MTTVLVIAAQSAPELQILVKVFWLIVLLEVNLIAFPAISVKVLPTTERSDQSGFVLESMAEPVPIFENVVELTNTDHEAPTERAVLQSSNTFQERVRYFSEA